MSKFSSQSAEVRSASRKVKSATGVAGCASSTSSSSSSSSVPLMSPRRSSALASAASGSVWRSSGLAPSGRQPTSSGRWKTKSVTGSAISRQLSAAHCCVSRQPMVCTAVS